MLPAIASTITIDLVTMTGCHMVAPGVAMGFQAGPDWTSNGGLPVLFLTERRGDKWCLGSVSRKGATRHEPAHYVVTLAPLLTGATQPRRRNFVTLMAAEFTLAAAGTAYAADRIGQLAA